MIVTIFTTASVYKKNKWQIGCKLTAKLFPLHNQMRASFINNDKSQTFIQIDRWIIFKYLQMHLEFWIILDNLL